MRLGAEPIAFRHLPDAPLDPERPLDLHRLLVRSPASTFLMRAADDVLANLGVRRGDVLVVDRAPTPVTGALVVAVVAGELVLRRLPPPGGPPCEYWGTVIGVARVL